MKSVLKSYAELVKFRLSSTVVATSVFGYILALIRYQYHLKLRIFQTQPSVADTHLSQLKLMTRSFNKYIKCYY